MGSLSILPYSMVISVLNDDKTRAREIVFIILWFRLQFIIVKVLWLFSPFIIWSFAISQVLNNLRHLFTPVVWSTLV
jgi:hypothetical protein